MSGLQKVVSVLPAPEKAGELDLVIEAGPYGLSCLWHKDQGKTIEGALIHYAGGIRETTGLVKDIRHVFESEPLLNESHHSLRIFHNVPESLVFPKKYFSAPNAAASLSLLFGESEACLQQEADIAGTEMICCYRIPEPVHSFFNSYLFSYHPAHPFGCLLRKTAQEEPRLLRCTLYPGCFRTILLKENGLQLAALYEYQTPEDIAYTLLNICHQHEISPDDLALRLDGLIDAGSNLYAELSKYFLKAEFTRLPPGLTLARGIGEYPSHYFNNLIELASCAS